MRVPSELGGLGAPGAPRWAAPSTLHAAGRRPAQERSHDGSPRRLTSPLEALPGQPEARCEDLPRAVGARSRASARERVDTIAGPVGADPLGYGEYVRLVAQLGHWAATPDGQQFVLREAAAEQGAERRREKRERAFRVQRAMRPLFDEAAPGKAGALSPMAKCGWVRFQRGAGVAVRVDVNGRGSIRGVASCGRRTCPTCGPRLLARDAELVEAGVQEHGYERTLMATSTVRHWRCHRLVDLRKGIVAAFVDLQRQRAFKRLLERYGGKVFVRVLETTHRDANGWHTHYHALVFVDRELADAELAAFNAEWSDQWQASVVRAMGRAHRPTRATGVKLTRCYRADYLTKLGIGAEVADVGRAKVGKGRTYWRIQSDWLDMGADVQSADARLLVEYIRDMRAARIVEWPRTGEYTRKKLDERHPEKKPAERESAFMHDEEWDALRRIPQGRAAVLRAAELAQPGHVDEAVRDTLDELLRGVQRRRGPPAHPARAP